MALLTKIQTNKYIITPLGNTHILKKFKYGYKNLMPNPNPTLYTGISKYDSNG